MLQAFRKWRDEHRNIYEFIMFNLMGNIATITNFAVLALGTNVLFRSLASQDFIWGPFNYAVENGGLAGFISFLLSYAVAQTVNFIVQRKAVFHANNKLAWPIVVYIITLLIVYFICLYVPTIITVPLASIFGDFAIYVSNFVNIVIQVIIVFPVMKLIIMKQVPKEEAEAA
jgi:putative flippase GtrA